MSRGGPQNRGKALANNTSGLAGIRFAWRSSRDGELLHPYVVVAWSRRGRQSQTSYSLNKHGRAAALELAIAKRRHAGLPVPSTSTALTALRRFLKG